MKHIFLKLVVIFLFNSSYILAQDKEIEILNRNESDRIVLSIKNNSALDKEVNLVITGTGFQKIKNPIIKTVKENETIEFIKLKPTSNKGIEYKVSYSYKSLNNSKATEVNTEKKEKKENISNSTDIDLNKGIIIFTKEGCPRCEKTIKYLNTNKIEFTELTITNNQKNNELMWKKINSVKPIKITFPVIINNEKLTHSHNDLDLFLKNLK